MDIEKPRAADPEVSFEGRKYMNGPNDLVIN